jgi:hypothetical protein
MWCVYNYATKLVVCGLILFSFSSSGRDFFCVKKIVGKIYIRVFFTWSSDNDGRPLRDEGEFIAMCFAELDLGITATFCWVSHFNITYIQICKIYILDYGIFDLEFVGGGQRDTLVVELIIIKREHIKHTYIHKTVLNHIYVYIVDSQYMYFGT